MLRVVVDPNVLVSAAIAGGNPLRVVELASGGLIGLVASPRLLDELRGVLARDKFLRWRTREQLDRFVAAIEVLVEAVPDASEVPAVSRDPNDDYLVALAAGASADVLCSGDRDLSGRARRRRAHLCRSRQVGAGEAVAAGELAEFAGEVRSAPLPEARGDWDVTVDEAVERFLAVPLFRWAKRRPMARWRGLFGLDGHSGVLVADGL